jgi:ABC-type Zn uptake system ZnuABC Zn-binding protein ZnuA
VQLGKADLLLENGMQLEAWVPRLVDASGNDRLAPGADRHWFATNGLVALEIPTAEDIAAGGHVHPAGNPHIWLDPLNLKIIARNVESALSTAAPAARERFAARRVEFERRIDEAFFGEELVAILGGRTLDRLHRAGRLQGFLGAKELAGEPLSDRLGGWLARARALPDKRIFTYHSTWSYFARSFGLEVVATLEEKPGIPPGPGHLEELSRIARDKAVRVVVAPPYYPASRIQGFAERIGAQFTLLPTQPGEMGSADLFDMVDTALGRIEDAVKASSGE